MDNETLKIPVILVDEVTAKAFSVFNPNDWGSESKLIIHSCVANYGLLLYSLVKIKNIFGQADVLCSSKFSEIKAQWEISRWDLSACTYLVDIPEAHLSIQSFLSNVKTFLDIFVQLISSEGIVSAKINGFHRKNNIIGGKCLHILRNNATNQKNQSALFLYDLICEHKIKLIDKVVNNRDLLIHHEKGLSKIMFGLSIYDDNGELKIDKVLKPSFNNEDFDIYADKIISSIEEYSIKSIEYIKNT
jgi:hypothetical protein